MNTHTISKTITVQNTAHLDEVTVHLNLDINCGCSSTLGSYTRSERIAE